MFRLKPIVLKLPPIPESANFLTVCKDAEKKEHDPRGDGSTQYLPRRRNSVDPSPRESCSSFLAS